MEIYSNRVVDLFAGPGGWSLACKRLGLDEIGIEFEKNAVATREANGFKSILGSVTDYSPVNFPRAIGLIASPPCQTFSMAGKGVGRAALNDVLTGASCLTLGERLPEFSDERTALVLEPLRWAIEAIELERPFRWIALEQVPTVLPVWQRFAEILSARSYSVAVGNLHAEQYGIPQTRKRAILIASLDRQVSLPTPTHSRYHTRSPQRLDPDVLPWVSMAESLGWGIEGRPSPTITGGGTDTGGAEPIAHLSRYQLTSGTRPNAATRAADEPAPALAFGHDSASYAWAPDGMTPAELVGWKRSGVVARFGNQSAPCVRVSVQEAGILQSFPRGFLWQGSKTKQYQQVGNAIPPLLAEVILQSVV